MGSNSTNLAVTKKPPQGGFFCYWRRGWDGRFAPPKATASLLGSNRVLIRNHTRPENKKAPQGGLLIFWRRGWDSNPRYGRTAHLISNQAHSTTLAPLLNFASQSCRRPADVGTPDLTRHRWWPALRAASPFKIAPGDFVDHYPSTRLPFVGCGLYSMAVKLTRTSRCPHSPLRSLRLCGKEHRSKAPAPGPRKRLFQSATSQGTEKRR